jgi:hypothetical protein
MSPKSIFRDLKIFSAISETKRELTLILEGQKLFQNLEKTIPSMLAAPEEATVAAMEVAIAMGEATLMAVDMVAVEDMVANSHMATAPQTLVNPEADMVVVLQDKEVVATMMTGLSL